MTTWRSPFTTIAGDSAWRQVKRGSTIWSKARSLPAISTPTITLEGDANGAPHPDPASYARRFTGKYQHRLVTGGIGHTLPQEAPDAFAQAVIDVGRI